VGTAAYNALINLCVDICFRNPGIKQKDGTRGLYFDKTPNGSLTYHRMFTATTCPGDYLLNRFEKICVEVNKRLAALLKDEKPAVNPPVQTQPDGVLIMGKPTMTATAMEAFLFSRNAKPNISCTTRQLAELFISEGNIEGVRGDIAFCQAIQETGWFRFGGDVKPEQNNFAGIGATGGGAGGAKFDTPQIGVRAQIHHLKAYASQDALVNANASPRFHLVTRGIAQRWIDLNGRWAVPGTTYGQSILKIFADLEAFKPPAQQLHRVQVGAFSVKSNADAMLERVRTLGFKVAFITPQGADKLFRVQLGAFSEKANADSVLADAKAKGLSAFINFG
jgi:hypothetical protein